MGQEQVSAAQVTTWRERLLEVDLDRLDDADRLAMLRDLEILSRTMSAVAARVQVGFHASQVAQQVARGVAPSRAGKAVPDDLATARMTSPYWGSRHLTSARALVREMPRTLEALTVGVIDGYQARAVTEATACLSPELRAEVDERLAGSLTGSSTAEILATTRSLVYEVDPRGYVDRARRAAKDRGVSIRPCPDVMGLLSARLPAPQAIACYDALRKHATALRAAGDPRTLRQLMADELYSRLTGRSVVDGVDVEVGLVITDAALFGGASDAADLTGYGPVPAETARDLLRPRPEAVPMPAAEPEPEREREPEAEAEQGPGPGPGPVLDPRTKPQSDPGAERRSQREDGRHADDNPQVCPDGVRCTAFSCTLFHGAAPQASSATPSPAPAPDLPPPASPESVKAAQVWLRRLFTDPVTGRLTARDGRRRFFTGSLREFVIARDRTCRNTWCGAPVRHVDHVRRFADEGPTDPDNGRGLCARCNLAREHPRQTSPPPESYRAPPPVLPVYLRAS